LLKSGEVLVAGGYAPEISLNSAEVYDPATEMWRPTGSFNTIQAIGSATLLQNGEVLAVGFRGEGLISAGRGVALALLVLFLRVCTQYCSLMAGS
jgi:hypothetical protein